LQALLGQVSRCSTQALGISNSADLGRVTKASTHCLHLLTAKTNVPENKEQKLKTPVTAFCHLTWNPTAYKNKVKLCIGIKVWSPASGKQKSNLF